MCRNTVIIWCFICAYIPHIYTYTQNQAQCLLNLSGDAVLLQPEHGSAQEPVNPEQDQPLNSMTLLPILDPVAPSSQSDPSSKAATSQVRVYIHFWEGGDYTLPL